MREVKLGLESGWQRHLEGRKERLAHAQHIASGADKGRAGGMQWQPPDSLLKAWLIFRSSARQKLGAKRAVCGPPNNGVSFSPPKVTAPRLP